VVFADHESYTLDKVMIDICAAHVLHAGFWAARRQIVGGGNVSIGIGGHRKLSGAIIRVCREQIESRDAVGRYTNDGGTGRIEVFFLLREPRLTFNRSVVVSYRSFLERLSLSATTINLHLSAIRRLADESAESGWLSPELAIGIRRVKGVKRLGRKMGNWLTRHQAQELSGAPLHRVPDYVGCHAISL